MSIDTTEKSHLLIDLLGSMDLILYFGRSLSTFKKIRGKQRIKAKITLIAYKQ